MTTQANPVGFDFDPALRRMIEATNREDTQAFLDAFADDAVVDDFGRIFNGKAQIKGWSDRENIGTHNRIEVTSVSSDRLVIGIRVSGDGYNGDGTFTVHSRGGKIWHLRIRG